MSFTFDERTAREPLGSSPLRRRRLLESLTNGITRVLSSSTSSNYFSEQYGSNHRAIYESASKLLSHIILDVMELSDDSYFLELRPEFVTAKITNFLFDEDTLPQAQSEQEMKDILLGTLRSLLRGSTEASIISALENLNQAGSIELRQTGEHSVSIISSLYSITSLAEGHRHLVLNNGENYSSTLAPLELKWGGDLHQHEIIDGVIQPYTNAEGVTHTHEMSLGLPSDVLKLQSNLKKVFDITKPAHVLADEITSIIGESISSPSEASVVGVGDISELDSTTLRYSIGVPFQEDMRKARVGAYESTLYGYVDGKNIRLNSTLLSVGDYIAIGNGRKKKVISISEMNFRGGSEIQVNWKAPRFNTLGEGVISAEGYFSSDVGNENISYLGEGELLLIDEVPYFVKYISVGVIFLTATLVTLDSTSGVEAGLHEIKMLDYQWETRALSYRDIVQTTISDSDTIKLLAPVRRVYKGLPLIAEDISVEGYSVLEFRPISNEVVLDQVVPTGTTLTFRVPYGSGDPFNFLSLNSQNFTLNSARKRGQVDTTSGRNRTGTIRYGRGVDYGHLPVANLYSSDYISPKVTKTTSVTTSLKGEKSLNYEGFVLGRGFTLNSYTRPAPISPSRVTDFATAHVIVIGGVITPTQMGFIPSQIISVIVDGVEVEYTYENYRLLVDVVDGSVATITAISETPLKGGQTWTKETDILSEGQVPFINPSSHSSTTAIPSPEEIMEDPLGLASDQLRTKVQKSESTYVGTPGEEVFYEDNVLSLSVSGIAYLQHIPIATNEPSTLRTGLSLNSSTSKLGVGSVLLLGLSSPFRVEQVTPRDTEDFIPLISEEVTTSLLLSASTSDNVPLVTEDLTLTYTLLSVSLDDIVPVISEDLNTSLLLTPSTITESLPVVTDVVSVLLTSSNENADLVPVISDEVLLSQSFSIADNVPLIGEELVTDQAVSYGDSVPAISESLTTSLILDGANIQENVPVVTDAVVIGFSVGIEDTIPTISELATELYSLTPVTLSDDVVAITDEVDTSYLYSQVDVSDTIPVILDGLDLEEARGVEDSVPVVTEVATVSIAFTRNEADSVPVISDDVSVGVMELSASVADSVPVISESVVYEGTFSLEDTLPLISDLVTTDLSLTGSGVDDLVPDITENVSTLLVYTIGDTYPLVTEDVSATLILGGISEADSVPTITDEVVASLSLDGVSETDTIPDISDDVVAEVTITNASVDSVPVATDVVGTSLTLFPSDISETIDPITDAVSTSYIYTGVSVSDTIPTISDEASGDTSASSDVTDIVPDISDDYTAQLYLTALSESDVVPDISEDVSTQYNYTGVVETDSVPTITDEISTNYYLFAKYYFDNVPVATDEVTSRLELGVSDSVPVISEGATTSLLLTPSDITDSVPVATDEATAEMIYPASTLFASVEYNGNSFSDTEEIYLFTEDDYNAISQETGQRTIFRSYPRSTTYLDSQGVGAILKFDPFVFRGSFSAYANTTPPSANLSWDFEQGSTTVGKIEPNIDYTMFVLSNNDEDDTISPDFRIAFQSASTGSNTETVMGASPTYTSLYPGTNAADTYYKHTLSVGNDGTVNFNLDTTPKAPIFPRGTEVRVFFFPQNINGSSGSLGSSYVGIQSQVPTVHDSTYVFNSGSSKALMKALDFDNPDNNAVFSYVLSTSVLYDIQVERIAGIDFKMHIEAISNANNGSEWNTLYTSADTLDYRGFDLADAYSQSTTFYKMIVLDNLEVVIFK